MKTLLLQPHADDIVFCAYQALAVRPDVVTVLQASDLQEAVVRSFEDDRAMEILGCNRLPSWNLGSEGKPDWGFIGLRLREFAEREYDHCIAPAYIEEGHEEHNGVAMLAQDAFGLDRLTRYATYRRGFGRYRMANEVIPQQGWAALKFRAMACYSSQIERESTRPWFAADDCLREWIA